MLKLEIGDPFSNDEHTAAEGAYLRLLKARKWLYLVSLFATLHAHEAVNYAGIGAFTHDIFNIGRGLAGIALLVALIPLLMQYILLVAQLVLSYRVVIKDRVLKKRDDAFSAAYDKLKRASGSLQSLTKQLQAESAILASLDAEYRNSLARVSVIEQKMLEAEKNEISAERFNLLGQRAQIMGELNLAKSDVHQLENNVKGQLIHNESRQREIESSRKEVEEADLALRVLRKNTPEANPFFVASEVALDVIRVSMPLAIAAYAMSGLLTTLISEPLT